MRYGPIGARVLGMKVHIQSRGIVLRLYVSKFTQVILPGSENGKRGSHLLDLTSGLRKDNMGLHLGQFFVGAEGQLGIVTDLQLLCVPRCASVNVAAVGINFNSAFLE